MSASRVIFTGSLVYVDSFEGGLVPAKVTAVDNTGHVTVRITANRRGWTRGELYVVHHVHTRPHIVPRTAVYVRAGQYLIHGGPVVALSDTYMATGEESHDVHKLHTVRVGHDGWNVCECGNVTPNRIGRDHIDRAMGRCD